MAEYGIPLKTSETELIEFGDADLFIVGQTDMLAFGVIDVPVGKAAGYDPGHKNADEMFYIVTGTAKIDYPTTGATVTVGAGEFTQVYRTIPHTITNVGDVPLKVVFGTCADREE